MPQPPERCLSRKAGIMRCCLKSLPCRGRACPARNFAMLPVNGLNPSGFLRGLRPRKKAPLSKGDSPQCGEMSRSDRGARARRAGRVSGLGDSDGPCLIAHYTRRRPGIPPPRLRSAPPFDKGGFLRGASGTPPTFLVKKLTAQILRFSACKSAPYVVQYKLTKYGKNRRNSKWNTAIRS